MNALAAIVPALGWALLGFLWQGTLVALLLMLSLHLVPVHRAQARYALACGALTLCLLLPLAGLWHALAASSGASANAVAAHTVGLTQYASALRSALAAWLETRLPMLVGAWSLAVLALTCRHGYGLWWVASAIRSARPEPARELEALARRIGLRIGLARPVAVLLTDRIDTPATAGWIRPVILVPASLASGMPLPMLEALIAHELAHVLRCDYLVNLVQSVVETLLFYHPAVWWISHVVRTEREHVADDLAARALGEPRRLALALRELAQFQASPHRMLQAAQGGELLARIRRLVHPSGKPQASKATMAAVGAVLLCAALAAHATIGDVATTTAPTRLARPAAPIASALVALPSEPAPSRGVTTFEGGSAAKAHGGAAQRRITVASMQRPAAHRDTSEPDLAPGAISVTAPAVRMFAAQAPHETSAGGQASTITVIAPDPDAPDSTVTTVRQADKLAVIRTGPGVGVSVTRKPGVTIPSMSPSGPATTTLAANADDAGARPRQPNVTITLEPPASRKPDTGAGPSP